MANKYDCAVVFANISNSKRGYYNIQLELIVEESKILPYQELTQLHVKKLEQQILDNPARWLWSHKRWKHNIPNNWPAQITELQNTFEAKFRNHV